MKFTCMNGLEDFSFADFATNNFPSIETMSLPSAGTQAPQYDWGSAITGVLNTAGKIYTTKTLTDAQVELAKAQARSPNVTVRSPLPTGYQYTANGQVIYSPSAGTVTPQAPQYYRQKTNLMPYALAAMGALGLYFALK